MSFRRCRQGGRAKSTRVRPQVSKKESLYDKNIADLKTRWNTFREELYQRMEAQWRREDRQAAATKKRVRSLDLRLARFHAKLGFDPDPRNWGLRRVHESDKQHRRRRIQEMARVVRVMVAPKWSPFTSKFLVSRSDPSKKKIATWYQLDQLRDEARRKREAALRKKVGLPARRKLTARQEEQLERLAERPPSAIEKRLLREQQKEARSGKQTYRHGGTTGNRRASLSFLSTARISERLLGSRY